MFETSSAHTNKKLLSIALAKIYLFETSTFEQNIFLEIYSQSYVRSRIFKILWLNWMNRKVQRKRQKTSFRSHVQFLMI